MWEGGLAVKELDKIHSCFLQVQTTIVERMHDTVPRASSHRHSLPMCCAVTPSAAKSCTRHRSRALAHFMLFTRQTQTTKTSRSFIQLQALVQMRRSTKWHACTHSFDSVVHYTTSTLCQHRNADFSFSPAWLSAIASHGSSFMLLVSGCLTINS